MKKKFIQLPKGYLSQSQVELWLRDPQRYIAIYMAGRDELRTSNSAMVYGKIVADALENGIQTGDLRTDAAMLMLPKYDVTDVEMRTEFKTKNGWLPMVIKPDSFNSETKDFYEYKTGKAAWTKNRASKHFQLKYYALGIWLLYKVIPNCALIWIETEDGPEGIRPTGRIERFDITFTKQDLIETMALTTRVAYEIEVEFAFHVPDERIINF